MSAKGMTRIQKFSLSEVLPHIGKSDHKFWIHETKRLMVIKHLSTNRMKLLKRTQTCAACFMEGHHFWLEKSGCFSPHFNLYGMNYFNEPNLMTMDHIIPKSKGGSTEPHNVQLLCEKCNRTKKNLMLTTEDILRMRLGNKFLYEKMRIVFQSDPEKISLLSSLFATRHEPFVEKDVSCFVQPLLD